MENTCNDNIFIEGLKRSEASAYQKLYDLIYKKMCLFVYNIVRSKEVAEEIVNDTFHKFIHLKENFEEINSIQAFFYTSCRNAALDYNRVRRRRQTKEITYTEVLENSAIEEKNILQALINAETISQLKEEIEKLPERRKAVVSLYYLYDYSSEQIASELGISRQTVLNTKQEALRQLKAAFMEANTPIELMTFLLINSIVVFY